MPFYAIDVVHRCTTSRTEGVSIGWIIHPFDWIARKPRNPTFTP